MSLPLFAVGFCGIDDSVDINQIKNFFDLDDIKDLRGFVEFGFLFRPENEGKPRFISKVKLEATVRTIKKYSNHLAGHICSSRCVEVLGGDSSYLKSLADLGFTRFQLNITKANGVDLEKLLETQSLDQIVCNILKCLTDDVRYEFIMQYNDETEELCKLIAEKSPKRLSLLFDSSKGTGQEISTFPKTLNMLPCGYAGGIGPSSIESILLKMKSDKNVVEGSKSRALWIDMESSLRSVVKETDIFDLEKCKEVLKIVKKLKNDGKISFIV